MLSLRRSAHAAVIACAVMWSDVYPIVAPNQSLYQGVKVELCEEHVEVSARVYQELATGEEYELSGWHVIARQRIKEVQREAAERQ